MTWRKGMHLSPPSSASSPHWTASQPPQCRPRVTWRNKPPRPTPTARAWSPPNRWLTSSRHTTRSSPPQRLSSSPPTNSARPLPSVNLRHRVPTRGPPPRPLSALLDQPTPREQTSPLACPRASLLEVAPPPLASLALLPPPAACAHPQGLQGRRLGLLHQVHVLPPSLREAPDLPLPARGDVSTALLRTATLRSSTSTRPLTRDSARSVKG